MRRDCYLTFHSIRSCSRHRTPEKKMKYLAVVTEQQRNRHTTAATITKDDFTLLITKSDLVFDYFMGTRFLTPF